MGRLPETGTSVSEEGSGANLLGEDVGVVGVCVNPDGSTHTRCDSLATYVVGYGYVRLL